MTKDLATKTEPGRRLELVGISEAYEFSRRHEIPEQWQRFAGIARDAGARTSYGVVQPAPSGFVYWTAIARPDATGVPAIGLDEITIDAAEFVVVHHVGNVAQLPATLDAVHTTLFPKLSARIVENVGFLERYGPGFDPKTGNGGIDILIPLKSEGASARPSPQS